jgi:phosphoribosyl-ATP pyrophosphohydrolase/phosphoribosyl-AMP cyclohydrolase/histidinol dehydrogenase
MIPFRWNRSTLDEIGPLAREPVDTDTLLKTATIVDAVRSDGERALRQWAERFGELAPGAPLVLGADELAAARARLPDDERALLDRTAAQIAAFAEAQLASIQPMTIEVPGGHAGQELAPMARAGCYAPGGRYPLPSSVLMTAVTARAAGVEEIWVASPKPEPATLAAASIAGATALIPVGGAQAIAALAYGAGPVPGCDVIVGPGNRWVTAAKKLVVGRVAIDMLAGPSELVVLADDSADAETVAADLLAQAEHDPDAQPVLVTTSEQLADAVEAALGRQLADLPTRDVALAALGNGFAALVRDMDEAAALCDRLAPEHLQVLVDDIDAAAAKLNHWGALFLGSASAEVLGDYGAGPNHTLPTGGSARSTGGLSVHHFLRPRTWLRLEPSPETDRLATDAAALGRMEGLEAHARAAERRLRRG